MTTVCTSPQTKHPPGYPGAVLAFDLGTSLGWAVRHADGRRVWGVERFENHPGGKGRRWLNFSSWLTDHKKWSGGEITAVFFERVDFIKTKAQAETIFGFEAILTRWCEAMGLPYQGYPVGTLKKSVTGNGRADKSQVVGALNEQGFPVTDHNAADALACLLHGIKKEDLG